MNSELQSIKINSHDDENHSTGAASSTNEAEVNSESNNNPISYITLLRNSSFINKGISFVEKFKMGSMISEMNATNKSPFSEEQVREEQQQQVIKSPVTPRNVDLQREPQKMPFISNSPSKQIKSSTQHGSSINNRKLFLSNESIHDAEVKHSIIKKRSPSRTIHKLQPSDKINTLSHSKTVHGCRDIAHISLEAAPKSSNLSASINDAASMTIKPVNRNKSGIVNMNRCHYGNYPTLIGDDDQYERAHNDPTENSKTQQYNATNDNTNLKLPTVRTNVSTSASTGTYQQKQNIPYSKCWYNVDEFNHLSRSCNSVLHHSPRQGNYCKVTATERNNKLLDELHKLYIQLKEAENQIEERDSYIRYLQSILFRRDQVIQQLIKQVPESYIPEEYYEYLGEVGVHTKPPILECHKPKQVQMCQRALKHNDKLNVSSRRLSRWTTEQASCYQNCRDSYLKSDTFSHVDQHENYSEDIDKISDVKIVTPTPVETTSNGPIISSKSHNKRDLPYGKIQYSKSGKLINMNDANEFNVGSINNSNITDTNDNNTSGIGMNLQILSKSRVKRNAISGESEKYLPPPTSHLSNWPKIEKPAHTKTLITQAILANDFMKHLDRRQISKIVDSMCPLRCARLSWIIQEGEVGSVVYVLEDGYVEVQKAGERLREMGPGTVFGELAILYNCTRTASVRAITDCKLWAIDRPCFQSIMMFTGIQKQTEYVKFLKSVPTFKDLNLEVLGKVSVVLGSEHYEPDEYVIREGERGNTFYIITGGKVKVTKNSGNGCNEQFIRYMTRGDWFGEKALTDEDVRTANIIAMPPRGVDCLMLDRDSYNVLIKDLVSFERSYPDEKPVTNQREKQFSEIKLTDFTVVSTIGIGGFGRVQLVYLNKDKRQCYALKKLKKHYVVETKQQEHVLNEKNILMETNHEFIVKLYRTYKDQRYLYILMEACLGGELWTLLRNSTAFDDSTARFYSACVVEALNYLHRKGIVYRDLKPENLLLDSQGFCKMTDFGFAKRIGYGNKTWTFCGTPEYVAPEVILNKGHDFTVDFWALGILMFELLTGTPPFTSSDPMKTYNIILKGINAIEFPKTITRNAQCLIKKLCRDAPAQRLGARKSGITEVKNHAWFEGFDWNGLIAKTIQVPITPNISSPIDLSNFDSYSEEDELPPEDITGWDKDF
ncbi:cGMP-dependent protein kinase 1 [Schistosoma japonicum]|nr:cGMP-dependent protein kinase 1 [Schistosoma japonicum]